jgi:hypothetical protein
MAYEAMFATHRRPDPADSRPDPASPRVAIPFSVGDAPPLASSQVVGVQIGPANPLSSVGSRPVTRSSISKGARWQCGPRCLTSGDVVTGGRFCYSHGGAGWPATMVFGVGGGRGPCTSPREMSSTARWTWTSRWKGLGLPPRLQTYFGSRSLASGHVLKVCLHLGQLHTSFLVAWTPLVAKLGGVSQVKDLTGDVVSRNDDGTMGVIYLCWGSRCRDSILALWVPRVKTCVLVDERRRRHRRHAFPRGVVSLETYRLVVVVVAMAVHGSNASLPTPYSSLVRTTLVVHCCRGSVSVAPMPLLRQWCSFGADKISIVRWFFPLLLPFLKDSSP